MGIFNTALHRSRVAFMVTTEDEALRELERQRPGILVVTERLDQGSGLALVSQARSVVDTIRTVLIVDSLYDDVQTAGMSSADAVFDQIDCFTADQPIVTLFRMLALNQRYRSRSVQAAMAPRRRNSQLWRDAPPNLTPRELEMVDLMVQGLSDRQIAERLGVSYETARSHGKNLRQKLGCNTRTQAVAKLLQLGLARLRST
jgi:DNA-binding NarL/FixJ family response regulator